MKNRYISFPPPDITVGLIIGGVVLLLLLVVGGVLVFTKQRKKRNEKKEEERTDDNPVYATYEVHDDPVAEVRTQHFIFCNFKENQSGFFSFRQ